MSMRRMRFLTVLLVVGLVAAACGGDSDDGGSEVGTPIVEAPSTTTSPPDTAAATTTADTAPPLAQAGGMALEDLDTVVVQIVSQGTFIDPAEGQFNNAAGSGTGFIVDPSGLVVTNNHVVTGAATLEVFVEGESYNASLVASSECSDLAVIDLEGDDWPTLEWYEGDIDVGLSVFSAGFPLGDPEFTLTSGIIAKAEADGESDWASVDAVLQHDARINPGNSGGPLVTEDGLVVGVNYAGASTTDENFAISRDEAIPVVERLAAGENVDWIGINGQAVLADDGSLSGVWVAAVESGSPASAAGIQAGDVITRLEGLVMATDGTMADYCDVLRTRADQAIAVEVLRFETGELLEGELNGAPLELAFSFADELADDVPADGGGDAAAPTGGYTYTTITDDTGRLVLDVPVQWSDVDGRPVDEQVLDVVAAPSLEEWGARYDHPGVNFRAVFTPEVQAVEVGALLSDFISTGDGCQIAERDVYSDPLYTGEFVTLVGCGGTEALVVVVVARPETNDVTLLVQVQVVSDADLEALDTVLSTFYLTE